MKTKTLRWLAGLGFGLGLAALSFTSCSQAPTACQVGLGSPYVAVFTPSGTVPACAQQNPLLLQGGDVFGMEFYHPANAAGTTYDDTITTMAVKSDSMDQLQIAYSDMMYPDSTPTNPSPATGGADPVFFTDGISGHAPYATGSFQSASPDANDICHVPTTTGALEAFTAQPGQAAPNLPAITLGDAWSNIAIYTTASVQGDQFTGTLARTVNNCTVTYSVVGLWPSINCTDTDMTTGAPKANLQFCSPCSNPDAGIATGSGINPNFPIACTAVYDVRDPNGRGGACHNLQTDSNNCGACGSPCDAGQICSGGACGTCPKGTTDCPGMGAPGVCSDTDFDANNCGGCGNACAMGQVCSKGTCVGTCAAGAGLTACNDPMSMALIACTDTQTDPNNCGGCGMACAAGQPCAAGTCGACPTGTTACGPSCTDTSSDPGNCGTCGTACNTGETCSGGKCTLVGSCPSGQTQCGGAPFFCTLTGTGTATGSQQLPQLNTDEPACAISM